MEVVYTYTFIPPSPGRLWQCWAQFSTLSTLHTLRKRKIKSTLAHTNRKTHTDTLSTEIRVAYENGSVVARITLWDSESIIQLWYRYTGDRVEFLRSPIHKNFPSRHFKKTIFFLLEQVSITS